MKHTEYLQSAIDATWSLLGHTLFIAIILSLVFATVFGILLRTKYKDNYFTEESAEVAAKKTVILRVILTLALTYWFWQVVGPLMTILNLVFAYWLD